jgi:hypothetical protein
LLPVTVEDSGLPEATSNTVTAPMIPANRTRADTASVLTGRPRQTDNRLGFPLIVRVADGTRVGIDAGAQGESASGRVAANR